MVCMISVIVAPRSRIKKAGYTVESFKPEGGERTYRINK
jgi:hypothetical protein